MQRPRFRPWSFAVLAMLLAICGSAMAVTVTGVDLSATAACSAHADVDVSWTGAGSHFEFGSASDATGSTIGTFGPLNADNDSFSGRYQIPITTAQPAGSVIGSYGWVGTNPPSSTGAAEFFLLYNCSTRAVLYRCTGAFGSCPNNARAALALVSRPVVLPTPVPTLSEAALIALMLLVALAAAPALRRRAAIDRTRE